MSDPVKPSEQKESPYTKALADISMQKWGMYKKDIRPVENRFMRQVDQMNTGPQLAKAGAMAQSNVIQQYNPVVQDAKAKLMETGAAPNSGDFIANMAKTRGVGATASGTADFTARQGQKDRYLAGVESIVGMGNGQANLAQNSMANIAAQSVEAAKQQAEMDWASKAAAIEGVGKLGGVALGSAMSKAA